MVAGQQASPRARVAGAPISLAAGADPVAITVVDPSRVEHVHLTGVGTAEAARVADGAGPIADVGRCLAFAEKALA